MKRSEFTPHEQQLIEQLRQSPSPELNQDAVEKLRRQLFAEADLIWGEPPGEPPATPARRVFPTWLLVVVAVVLFVVIIAVIFGSLTGQTQPVEETPAVMPTHTPLPPSQTHMPAATISPSLTATPEPMPTEAGAPIITAPPEPIEAESVIVIEGPITYITERYIIIFEMIVEIDGLEARAGQFAPGIVVRVEGEPRVEGGQIIIKAAQIAVLQPPEPPSERPPAPSAPQPPGRDDDSRSSRSS